MMSERAPFPLDGGRVGDGGVNAVAASQAREASSSTVLKPSARTPTQPSPIEGEGLEVQPFRSSGSTPAARQAAV